jgi:cyclic pyranopterin phosphate synthase
MGAGAPALEEVVEAAASLPLRATCVLTRGWVDDTSKIWSYIHELGSFGVREFTFKHTYVAYEHSVFAGSDADEWARAHQIDFDPFESQGTEVATLPWGPKIRRIKEMKVCFYREPTPDWELQNGIGRSTNLLSNGEIYGSLEDRRSLLYRLTA